MRERGFTSIATVIILVIGLTVGVVLVQQKTNFFPKASSGRSPSVYISSVSLRNTTQDISQASSDQEIIINFQRNYDVNAVNLWISGGDNSQITEELGEPYQITIPLDRIDCPNLGSNCNIIWPVSHPKHKPGIYRIGIHPYYCTPIDMNNCQGGKVDSREFTLTEAKTQTAYKLTYCLGHSGTVNNIKIENNKIIPADRSGYLSSPAYDYKCFIVNTDNSNKQAMTISDLNNLSIQFSETSPDGYKITRILQDSPGVGGLIIDDVFVTSDSQCTNKIALEHETSPTQVLKVIGWTK